MFRLGNLLMVRIRRRRDANHFGVVGVVGAGRGLFHFLILILRIWIRDSIIFRLIIWEISYIGVINPS